MTRSRNRKAEAARSGAPKKRPRLPSETRRQQILDAALMEFSAHGFGGASISKIAERAGMSKANFYVHFNSKSEILETLLKSVLDPSKGNWQVPQVDQSLEEKIDGFIENQYNELTPRVVAVIRLMITEGHRMPSLMERWYREAILPAHAKRQEIIQGYVEAGLLERTPLTEYFGLAMAPVLYAAVFKMVFPEELADAEVEKIKEAHRKTLHMSLKK